MSHFAFLQAEWAFLHEAAHRAEQAVSSGPRTTPNQIEFINLVVQELTQTGVMEPGRLF